MVNGFEEEVRALEEYGHDCSARIDDRIHECCKRIREAHEQELDNTQLQIAKMRLESAELPKDADDEVWRIGDELLDDGMVCEVVGIGPNRLYYYVDATDTVEWTQADSRRHHHAPTVEDVLREMADRCYADEDEPRDRDAIVAEYAAKLRLAEGVDE